MGAGAAARGGERGRNLRGPIPGGAGRARSRRGAARPPAGGAGAQRVCAGRAAAPKYAQAYLQVI